MDPITLLIVCPLVFLAMLVDAIAGGGGLISLTAYLVAGLPPHVALGTNKVSSAIGTVVATARFAKSGLIKIKLAIPAVISRSQVLPSARRLRCTHPTASFR